MNTRLALLLATFVAATVAGPLPSAGAAPAKRTVKKAMWGPSSDRAFRYYRDMGVGIYETRLSWSQTAPARPGDAKNPSDPAYRWPATLDAAVKRARHYRMAVSLMVLDTPAWANGGRDPRWAPTHVGDYAQFLRAAARRYPSVHLWMIWGEPCRAANWQPLSPDTAPGRRGRPLSAAQRVGPQRYAQLLDAAYGGLKVQSRSNKVIGGNCFTTGDLSVFNWVRYMRMPNGRAPRMDMWGHNPFSTRTPDLRKPQIDSFFADFSDLDVLARWLDRYIRPYQPGRPRLKLYLSEFTAPTDNHGRCSGVDFNFCVTRSAQVRFTSAALKITRHWWRIYTMGWHTLTDDAPGGTNRGLLTYSWSKKPAYYAFKRG